MGEAIHYYTNNYNSQIHPSNQTYLNQTNPYYEEDIKVIRSTEVERFGDGVIGLLLTCSFKNINLISYLFKSPLIRSYKFLNCFRDACIDFCPCLNFCTWLYR
jgi:hypothetical protein